MWVTESGWACEVGWEFQNHHYCANWSMGNFGWKFPGSTPLLHLIHWLETLLPELLHMLSTMPVGFPERCQAALGSLLCNIVNSCKFNSEELSACCSIEAYDVGSLATAVSFTGILGKKAQRRSWKAASMAPGIVQLLGWQLAGFKRRSSFARHGTHQFRLARTASNR